MAFFRGAVRTNSFLIFLAAAMLWIGGGCATRVYPPVAPVKPTTIYLCDYGIHSSLLLPNGDGRFVEYVYGDWDFAALNKTDPIHTLIALFGSCQPALGRRYLRPASGSDVPSPPNPPHTIEPMQVDGERVKRVVREMNRRFRRHIETAWLNDWPNYFFTFVYDDESYSILHNCNWLTGQKLKDLGCKVRGRPIFSNFIVEAPGEPQPPKPAPVKPGFR